MNKMYRKTIERTSCSSVCASIHSFNKDGKLLDLVAFRYFKHDYINNSFIVANVWADKILKEINQ